MTQPRTANFWEALKSAAANPGEVWCTECSAFKFRKGGVLSVLVTAATDYPFVVSEDDLTATWTCET